MRKKSQKLIVTFHTTADAIGFEKAARGEGLLGRMIPVPRELSAGCGLAWCGECEMRKTVDDLLLSLRMEAEEIAEMLY